MAELFVDGIAIGVAGGEDLVHYACIYVVGYKSEVPRYTLRASYDIPEPAIAEAQRIAEAENTWVHVRQGNVVHWDNGDEPDETGAPLQFRVMVDHMVADGVVTGPHVLGRHSLTPKGYEWVDMGLAGKGRP